MSQSILAKIAVQLSLEMAKYGAQAAEANKKLDMIGASAKRLQNVLLGTFGASQIYAGLVNTITVLAEFDQQMASLKAISGATNAELLKMKEAAISLGSSSLYSAKAIGEMQVEFARLGFSTKEILNATAATVDLATATGEGLARSAEIAGSTLRAYGLDSKEMTRVTDTMAESLNKTALTLDSFADAIKYVSPVARAVDVSLEETSAMLGVLANAGIKGSQAGTSLRRIFTMLTADGRPLQERMRDLAATGITLADAHDEVGLYAQTALLVLAKELDQVNQLTIGFRNATGATKEMAAVMRDNLAGDLTRVKNSWDSLLASQSWAVQLTRYFAQGLQKDIDMLSGQSGFNEAIQALDASIGDLGEVAKKELFVFADFEKTLIRLKKEGVNIDFSDSEIKKMAEGYRNADIIVEKYIQTLKRLKTEESIAPYDPVADSQKSKSSPSLFTRLAAETAQNAADRQLKIANESSNGLQAAIDDLDKKAKASNDKGEIAKYRQEIEKLKEEIYTLDPTTRPAAKKEKVIKKDENEGDRAIGLGAAAGLFDGFGTATKKPADESQLGEEAIGLGAAAGFFDSIPTYIEDTDKLTESWVKFGTQAAGVIATIISADKNFGKSIKKTASEVIKANVSQIVTFLAKKFALDSSTKGYGVAIAGLAIGVGVVAGLLGKDWKKVNKPSPSREGGRMPSDYSASGSESLVGVIRGQDLHVVMTNYKRNNRSTQGG